MATVTSTASSTLVAMLSTVTTVAHQTNRTIQTAAAGLDMLDKYVEGARSRQEAKSRIDTALFHENLLLESSMEQARKEKMIQAELSSDKDLNSLFNSNYAKLQALFVQPETQS